LAKPRAGNELQLRHPATPPSRTSSATAPAGGSRHVESLARAAVSGAPPDLEEPSAARGASSPVGFPIATQQARI